LGRIEWNTRERLGQAGMIQPMIEHLKTRERPKGVNMNRLTSENLLETKGRHRECPISGDCTETLGWLEGT
jgi:hypothetical protein